MKTRATLFFSIVIIAIDVTSNQRAFADEPISSGVIKSEIVKSDVPPAESPDIQNLRDDVRSLRDDVRRLCDLIEKQQSKSPVNSDAGDVHRAVESPASQATDRLQEKYPGSETNSGKVLVFMAAWCGPCQQIKPVVAKLKRLGASIELIDVDREIELARQFHIESIPCLVFVKDGKEIERRNGAQSEEQVREFLSSMEKNVGKSHTKSDTTIVRENSRFFVDTYLVADLVTQVPNFIPHIPASESAKAITTTWLKLVDQITTCIEPSVWEINGGGCTIRLNEETLSLIIRAPAEIHDRVHKMFDELRREQDVQITMEIVIVQDEEGVFDPPAGKIKFKFERYNAAFTTEVIKKLRPQSVLNPKMTAFNGQVVDVAEVLQGIGNQLPKYPLYLRGTSSEDHSSVRLGYAFSAKNLVNELMSQSHQICNGESLLIDITDHVRRENPGVPLKGKTLVLICPRVIVPVEEQEVLNK